MYTALELTRTTGNIREDFLVIQTSGGIRRRLPSRYYFLLLSLSVHLSVFSCLWISHIRSFCVHFFPSFLFPYFACLLVFLSFNQLASIFHEYAVKKQCNSATYFKGKDFCVCDKYAYTFFYKNVIFWASLQWS